MFVKGEFKPYKAITKIHLGAIEDNLEKDEVILFDGSTMKRGTAETPIPTLKGAIKVGWLVPDGETGQYVSKKAGVKVHSAKNMGEKPSEIDLETVYEEERGLGSIQEVRPDNAPNTHIAKSAGETHARNTDEGRVIGKFTSSAKSDSIIVGRDDKAVVQNLDNKSEIGIEKVRVATGDVEEALSGESLQDILPEAVSSDKPVSGIFEEPEVDNSEFETSEQPLESTQVAKLKIEMLSSLVPDFNWDLTDHWKTRVKNALTYKDNPAVFDQILSFESPTVVRHIQEKLKQ